ncbi:MAG: iron-containing alcohol dehydrogenase [Deferribacterales bacterium]
MLTNFYIYSPVKLYVEVDPKEVLLNFFKSKNCIGVISGKNAVLKTGFKEFLLTEFRDKDLYFFDEVEENPSINNVIKAGRFLRDNRCEAVVAFGGGSAIDAGKAAAVFAENNLPFYELLSKEDYNKPIPLLAIPTTCGTGSEMNNYSIITDIEKADKVNFNKPDSYPEVALLWSDYLKTLDERIIIATAFDAFTHAFEGYISIASNPFTDILAIEAMEIIVRNIKEVIDKATLDLKELLFASSLAGIVIAHTGTTLLHALGYYLTNHYKIHHGEANAILLPSFIDICKGKGVGKVTKIEEIFKKNRFNVSQAVKEIFHVKIYDIIDKNNAVKMIDYALNKPNSKKTPFIARQDYILNNLF